MAAWNRLYLKNATSFSSVALSLALLFSCAQTAGAEDPELDKLLKKAQAEMSAKNYLNAMIHADKAIKAHPENQLAHYYRGLCLHYLNNLKDARVEYEAARVGTNSLIAKRADTALATLPKPKTARVAPPPAQKPRLQPSKTAAAPTNPAVPAVTTPNAVLRPTLILFLNDDPTSNELGPILQEFERKYRGQVRLLRYRVEDAKNRTEVEKYNIDDVPAAVFLDKEGRDVERMTDFSDARSDFATKIDALLR